jgi:subtilisin family serine protease
MNPLDLVKLTWLMERTEGSPEVKIGLIDGPVATEHPDLAGKRLRKIPGSNGNACFEANSVACLHGTFVAGILSGKRTSPTRGICPECTLLIRPIFAGKANGSARMPSAVPKELADALIECMEAGARVINMSLSLASPSIKEEYALEDALNRAIRQSVIVVAAAGNQGTLGSSAITRHPWVLPVVACDLRGRPTGDSNLGSSIGRRGLTAPGHAITSVSASGQALTLSGTSVAVPFVTGTIALLWSEFPTATAVQIKLAVSQASVQRASVVPPLLDATVAYQSLLRENARGRTHDQNTQA